MTNREPRWIGIAFAVVVVVGFALGLGFTYRNCERDQGTLVKGVFWFACVEKGKHP